MTVSELLSNIKLQSNYISNSIYLKSYDNYGCVYKWLIKSNDIAIRKEIFVEFYASEILLPLLSKTVVNSVEVYPAQ